MTLYKKTIGREGEELTVKYLKKLGFNILSQNYKSKLGEIDIIAQKDEVLAFVEVKFRKDSKVSLSDLINYAKQQKIIKTASLYIAQNNFSHIVYRFDVALLNSVQNKLELNYIQNAFTVNDYSAF